MNALLTLAALFCALAGRVLAFNITVGSTNLTSTQILDISPSFPVVVACNANVTDAQNKITTCAEDPTCLCKADTVQALLDAETCMLHFLINTNAPMPDFRAGSNPVLGAYATSCAAANQTLTAAQTLLQLPASWDGPFVAVLPVGSAAVAVIVGAGLGISALLLLSNM